MVVDREVMQYDVVVVGAGPAGLACAIRLKQCKPELSICVLEKGAEVGSHILSGAVMQPDALDELLPGWRDSYTGTCVAARKDQFRIMSKRRSWWFPLPPQMNNHGNFIVSLGALCTWMASKAEELEIDVFPGFPAASAIIENNCVTGVRCGDMGRNADGSPGLNFAAGVDIHANLTVLAEGCRGSVSKQLIRDFKLDENSSPQTYGLGFKELWQLPAGHGKPGLIQHSIGWPLDSSTYGGSFIYYLDNDQVYVGFVVGLDYRNPGFDPFEAFQQFKHHPSIYPLLKDGEIISSGARALIEGGIQSLPRLELPGALLIGDAAGTMNVAKIKGIHMAMRSGMLAADHFATHASSTGFDNAWRSSGSARELKRVRNMRPGFRAGLWAGLANAAYETVTFGASPWTLENHADWSSIDLRVAAQESTASVAERSLPPRDRLASVYFASTAHDEAQPGHLKVADTSVCVTRCSEEYGNPCTSFCPAQVYEIVEDATEGKRLQINAANCVHCKACDIKDPYELITWTTPEGGSGPNYQNL